MSASRTSRPFCKWCENAENIPNQQKQFTPIARLNAVYIRQGVNFNHHYIIRMKRILIAAVLTASCFAVKALPANDTLFVFEFPAAQDIFYVPFRNNGDELQHLLAAAKKYKTDIKAGNALLHVDGYCTSAGSLSKNIDVASLRANRVKSELIVRRGLKEEYFVTRNLVSEYEGMSDAVTVTLALQRSAAQPSPAAPNLPDLPDVPKEDAAEQKPAPVKKQPVPVREDARPVAEPQMPAPVEKGRFSVRTNLLYWLVLLPNIGIEYKPAESFGVLVNGGWSHWSWKERYHRIWFVQPELRGYLGEKKRWFVGVEGHAGQCNFKFYRDKVGRQGDFYGAGLTGGYKLRLNGIFDLDFSLGLGYTRLEYEKYYSDNGVFVRKAGNLKKNLFSPTQVNISLIRKLK
jgi:hypothetical protein